MAEAAQQTCCHDAAVPRSAAPAGAGPYICPMCPGVESAVPASCPKCGMALESAAPVVVSRVEYSCPMHPEILRDAPGDCPICGMALEPTVVSLEPEANPELIDMSRRFWIGAVLTLPLLVLAMGHMLPALSLIHI